MSINIQKGNMYGFVTHTWNTVKGKCPHDCSYCYMKRFPQPELHFDEKELKTNLGEGNFIFIGSSCDMFADKIPKEWIEKTLEHCCKYPDNKYLFQSKNPHRFKYFINGYPKNTILCSTIETNRIDLFNYSGGTQFTNRTYELKNLSKLYYMPIIVTVEPIIDFNLLQFVEILKEVNPFQINIGSDSGNNHLPEPSKEKILELISELEKFTVVHQKQNLKRLLK